jgi:hypothetical protein
VRAALPRHLRALAIEAATVLSAEELELEDEDAVELVIGVARATAQNRSSMLQDVEAGRPTEMEFITGAILGMAAFPRPFRADPPDRLPAPERRNQCQRGDRGPRARRTATA